MQFLRGFQCYLKEVKKVCRQVFMLFQRSISGFVYSGLVSSGFVFSGFLCSGFV